MPVEQAERPAKPTSSFASIPAAPPDPILGLTEMFNADPNPNKVNLGVGVYQNENGKVPALKVVREAEKRLLERELSKTYLPIDGAPAFSRAAKALLFGADSPLIAEGRAVTAQALGGTGALKIGADLLRRFFPHSAVWLSSPSWENHQALFEAAGFAVKRYPYHDPETNGLDFDGMTDALRSAPADDIVLLHACCHNPTGVDPTPEQWKTIASICRERAVIPFLDFAYQGFGDGIDADRFAVSAFAEAGMSFLVATSFSKSFSLYGERVGALTILARTAEEAERMRSQLKRVIRSNYSSPPAHGGLIVATILEDQALTAQWEQELTEMRERIRKMRRLFVRTLKDKGAPGDFDFIERQKGMFSYSGLSAETARRLRAEYGVYIVDSGRICIAAMNENNMDAICRAIAGALKLE